MEKHHWIISIVLRPLSCGYSLTSPHTYGGTDLLRKEERGRVRVGERAHLPLSLVIHLSLHLAPQTTGYRRGRGQGEGEESEGRGRGEGVKRGRRERREQAEGEEREGRGRGPCLPELLHTQQVFNVSHEQLR